MNPTRPTRPIPPEIKAANRARALQLVAERGDRPMTPKFAAVMRTVILPAYRQVLADEARQSGKSPAIE